MSSRSGLLLLCLALIFVLLSCVPSPSPNPTDELISWRETSLAMTVTAWARINEITPTQPTPTLTPEPTSTQLPTPTLAFVLDSQQPLNVAYVMDNDVWYWQEGNYPSKLTDFNDVRDVAISDDGSLIAFSRELEYGRWELWVVAVDLSMKKVLVDEEAFVNMIRFEDELTAAPLTIDWVPGESVVIFNTFRVYEGPGLPRDDELQQVDVETTTLEVLIDIGQAGNFYYSPDGQKIALVQPTSISVANADGTERRELFTFSSVNTTGQHWYFPSLIWNADSTAVKVLIPPDEPQDDAGGETAIWNIPINGTDPYVLSTMNTLSALYGPAAISPDGTQVLYLNRSISNPAQYTLFISNVNGTSKTIYDSGLIGSLHWSPDNRHFIYPNGETYVLGEIDSDPRGLNIAYPIFNLEFVDNNRYLYRFNYHGTQELWLGSIDGNQMLIDSGSGVWLRFDYVK